MKVDLIGPSDRKKKKKKIWFRASIINVQMDNRYFSSSLTPVSNAKELRILVVVAFIYYADLTLG